MSALPSGAWLPRGKSSAICFTVDDVHPGRSTDAYEAGGDLGRGALGNVAWLLDRHPRLHVTLFTTADWRELQAVPSRRLLRRIPWLRQRLFLSAVLPKGTMRLDRHPAFVAYLGSLPRTEVGLHGLHHVHLGERIFEEFQEEDEEECGRTLDEILSTFASAGLAHVRGMQPPGWNLTPALLAAMVERGFSYVTSARDIRTPVSSEATTRMSGLQGVSLTRPELLEPGGLVHFTSNFQATSSIDRALAILRCGGLLAVKAHIVKNALGHVMLDGMDTLYANYLDLLFSELDREFGDSLWWTTMGQIAGRIRAWRAHRIPAMESGHAAV